MTGSKRLVAGTANRMISFYDLKATQISVPTSRFEDLIGIPLCLEYYRWPPENNDGKFETLLVGNELGICTMYNFFKAAPDWHSCTYRVDVGDLEPSSSSGGKARSGNSMKNAGVAPLVCHKEDILKRFKANVDADYDAQEKKMRAEKERLNERNAATLKGKKQFEGSEHGIDDASDAGMKAGAGHASRTRARPMQQDKFETGFKTHEILIHNSWITKIKYYPDLQYIISSSLDSLIHIHDIDLKYKSKTFNLHQKGVNSFYYSRKHKFVASCGEERHVIIWNPYTRRVVTYLYGHNTSVQDLAMNEERHHLISLGTDKQVNIWDKTFNRIQSITDKVQYRLTSIVFDPYTNNILLGSRKINAWNFHTQEEIKTSHEHPVCFALNNIEKFESVISADDGGFVSVWDIENGKLLFKFGDTHGEKTKITAGCFDSYQRRLVTAGKDGTVKMWNFSNGSKLKDHVSHEAWEKNNSTKVDSEVTALVCICDEEKDEGKDSHIVAVGWDRKIHQWHVDDDEELVSKPQNQAAYSKQQGHQDDIMSAVYSKKHGLLFTGGHDGTLFAWSFETGSIKKTLHEADPSCTSKDYIRQSKSVDQLVILERRGKLLSMTADQMLRFWTTDELKADGPNPSFKFRCNHPDEDNLTAVAVTEDNDIIVTGDTSGQMKMWDISKVDFDDQSTEKHFIEKYFIVAHRGLIN